MPSKNILIVLMLGCILVFPSGADALSVTIITDIHAGTSKIRDKGEENRLYPKNYLRCLKKVKKLKSDLIVSTGDNVDIGEKRFYKRLSGIMRDTPMLWAKGNHDNENFKILSKEDYFADFENWRFIVLNTSEKNGTSTGYLENYQINDMKKWLATNKNVAIAIHHTPFFYNSRENIYTSIKAEPYEDFFKALTPNVKYVFSGHWHRDQKVELNGITFLTQKALTQDNKCNYTQIEL